MQNEQNEPRLTEPRDGSRWQIGRTREVDWVTNGTTSDLTITSAIPPVFDAYATVVVPADEHERRDRALITVLGEHSAGKSWWLGYLETGSADVVFPNAPRVTMYAGWDYVLVAAGPQQAATWRSEGYKGVLPDLMFPADRSWLISTLWDDDWTCVGGSGELVGDLLRHPDLQGYARRVETLDEDATPPGHTAI